MKIPNEKFTMSRNDSETPKSDVTGSTPTISSTTGGSASHKIEESQNVLLKQLLQNIACATTTGSTPSPLVPSLETQLSRPIPPAPSSLLPSLLNDNSVAKGPVKQTLITKETSFLSVESESPKVIVKEEVQKLSTTVTSSTNIQPHQRAVPTSFGKQAMSQGIKVQPSLMQQHHHMQEQMLKTQPVTTQQMIVGESQSGTYAQAKSLDQWSGNASQAMTLGKMPIHQGKPMVVSAPSRSNSLGDSEMEQQPQQQPQQQPLTQRVMVPVATSKPQQMQQQHLNMGAQQMNSAMSRLGAMGAQAQVPMCGVTQQPLLEIKKEIMDEVHPNTTTGTMQINDTKEFLVAKEEMVDGGIDDKTG